MTWRGCGRPPYIQPEGDTMKPTKKLHDLGQSLWLDNITRELLNSGTLKRYIDDLSVTGLTSNPTIFDNAIKNSAMYDEDISRTASVGQIGRGPVLRPGPGGSDARRRSVPADLCPDRMAWTAGCRSRSRRSWPTTRTSTLAAALDLHKRGWQAQPLHQDSRHRRKDCPPSRRRSSPACRSTSHCCSLREQYVAAADAYLRGVERRIAAGLNPAVASVASLFVSRWDVAVAGKVPG